MLNMQEMSVLAVKMLEAVGKLAWGTSYHDKPLNRN
jgi:hypothetical protein